VYHPANTNPVLVGVGRTIADPAGVNVEVAVELPLVALLYA
jgi:hypothetical protein